MRPLPTRVHGILDYIVGGLLIAAPWLLGFAYGGPETWVPVILGISMIAYSLLTHYEDGVVGWIPMPIHLWLDGIGGLLLALSPWIFGFADLIWWPHVFVGIAEISVALLTQTRPRFVRTTTPAHPGRPRPV
jgi:hypothetical protein